MIGQTVSHYRVVEKLAAAAWVSSTRRRHPLHRFVALKFLPDEVAAIRKP